jgi:HEPN domain-containing protein
MLAVVQQMQRVFETENLAAGSVLRKLLLDCRRLCTIPEDVVRRVLRFESRYQIPRTVSFRQGGRKQERQEGLGKADQVLGVKEEVPIGLPRHKKR